MGLDPKPVCIGMVLSAGGLRGAAHLGVLRRLVYHRVPVEAMVGVSAGAIIAAYYAAVGLGIEEMIAEAPVFRGRHLVMHGVASRVHASVQPYLRRFCGIIPERLQQLEAASFTRLHHGIKRLGIVCHDIDRRRPCYFSTGDSIGARLSDVTRASAAVPFVLPLKTIVIGTRTVRLTDGGISDSLPIDHVRSPLMGATHVIASDCRASAPAPRGAHDWLVHIRPDLDGIASLHAPRAALMKAVCRGEAAVTAEVVDRIQSWMHVPV